jgi:hypothetical protein
MEATGKQYNTILPTANSEDFLNSLLKLPTPELKSILPTTTLLQLTSLELISVLILDKIKVTLRLAVWRQSVSLGVKPLETHGQRSFFFQQSHCGNSPYVIYSLTRRWICLL